MIAELQTWLDANAITYQTIDHEVVDIPDFGKLFLADLSDVKSIFRIKDERTVFNLTESPDVLMAEGINYAVFPFGQNWYYYDLREEFRFNILKYIGRRKESRSDIPFVNLGVHSSFELLNGSGDLSIWVRKAQWMGHTALGICDRNTMAGTLNFQKACEAANLHPVFGYSFVMEFEGERIDMKAYALTQSGLAGLLRIQKEIMVDSDEHVLSYELLLSHGDGVALVFSTQAAEWMRDHVELVEQLRGAFQMAFYQIDLNEYKADRIDSQRLLSAQTFFRNFYNKATDSFLIEPILITDSYYIDPDDARNKIVLNKIATGAAHEQSEDQYFKSVDEHYATLRPLFGPEWDFDSLFVRMCRGTVQIAEAADAHFVTGQMFMPQYMMRSEEKASYGDRRSMFRCLLDEGLQQKIPISEHTLYRERLEEEVYVIESTNNVDYFLVQWDMVQEAHRRGIVTGIGRGSAGGSLVSYLLGITSVDPLRYGLIFSRFLVPERCGLQWREQTTIIADQVPIRANERYVEIEADGDVYHLYADSQLHIIREDIEQTIYADELSCGDEIIFDRRDCLWILNQLKVNDSIYTHQPIGKL